MKNAVKKDNAATSQLSDVHLIPQRPAFSRDEKVEREGYQHPRRNGFRGSIEELICIGEEMP